MSYSQETNRINNGNHKNGERRETGKKLMSERGRKNFLENYSNPIVCGIPESELNEAVQQVSK
jgi:hypothetical protein